MTTIWVKLPGLSLPLYDYAFIDVIVSTFGYFVGVDGRTKACISVYYVRAWGLCGTGCYSACSGFSLDLFARKSRISAIRYCGDQPTAKNVEYMIKL